MFRGDREIAFAAVQHNGLALVFATEELRGDREIVLAAVHRNGYALQFATEKLRGDREIVLAALQRDGLALQFATEELRGVGVPHMWVSTARSSSPPSAEWARSAIRHG